MCLLTCGIGMYEHWASQRAAHMHACMHAYRRLAALGVPVCAPLLLEDDLCGAVVVEDEGRAAMLCQPTPLVDSMHARVVHVLEEGV